tara:strand:+ start:56 stop:307 length:252 start_codon:yes stop_codon:yes gene_type:complete
MDNEGQQLIKFFVITYTSWTHQRFIQDFTAGEVQFAQQVIQNEEVYGQLHVRASVDYYNKLKQLLNSNTDLSFNLEYAPVSAK